MSAQSGGASRPITGTAVLGALGVVYGDIGTSPLYALDKTLSAAGGEAVQAATVLSSPGSRST